MKTMPRSQRQCGTLREHRHHTQSQPQQPCYVWSGPTYAVLYYQKSLWSTFSCCNFVVMTMTLRLGQLVSTSSCHCLVRWLGVITRLARHSNSEHSGTARQTHQPKHNREMQRWQRPASWTEKHSSCWSRDSGLQFQTCLIWKLHANRRKYE